MRILIATDGSEFSSDAVKTACQLVANPQNTSVKVVSVAEAPVMVAAAPYAFPVEYDTLLDEEFSHRAKQTVAEAEEVIDRLLPDLGGKLTAEVLRGSPERAIVEEAENWGADLIVVGSHGYGFWKRILLGSVSGAVVRHAPCSVLVVRKPTSSSGRHLNPQKVLPKT